jgi:virginiamycin B lyase
MSKPRRKAALIASALGLSLLLASVVQAASIGTLRQFKTPTSNSSPNQIAQGSDGNMWFTENTAHVVARITPAGDVTEFAACSICFPDDIAQGPDGILYFTNNDTLLGRITTDGEVLPGISPGMVAHGSRLATHADTVWITDFTSDVLWRYDITADTFTSVAPPTPNSNPGDIAVDANGVVWFAETDPLPGAIASYDPAANVFTETPVPAGAGFPSSIAIAANGTVWYAKAQGDRVGRLDPATREIREFPVGAGDRPAEIAASPDGSLWFTQALADNMARISPDGIVTAETKRIAGSLPAGIAVAAKGDPWYVAAQDSKVVTLRLK